MLINKDFTSYKILATTSGEKIEKIGSKIIQREESNALPCGSFSGIVDSYYKEKAWHPKLEPWIINYKDLKFVIEQGKTHHIGIFPEQASNWDWIQKQISMNEKPSKFLNLFAYTGAATVAAAKVGCEEIVHIDALKTSIEAAKENVAINNLSNEYIRFIQDDVMKFLKREDKRGRQYDGIVMDPPSFGRGPKGEIWKIEKDLEPLLDAAVKLLQDHGKFLIINTYSKNLSKHDVEAILQKTLKKYNLPCHTRAYDLMLPIENTNQFLESGQTVRWALNENNL
ncbi:MAG TPA: class I SAM-dependent methyltransferase [Erysipelothrix sp.]